MSFKKSLLSVFMVLVSSIGFAQDDHQIVKTKWPERSLDTSQSVIMTEKTGEALVSKGEQEGPVKSSVKSIAYEDSENPGTFIADVITPSDVKKAPANNEGVIYDLVQKPANISTQTKLMRVPFGGIDLDQHALTIAAGCKALDASGKNSNTVVGVEDLFIVIPLKSSALPPFPANGGKQGLHGVDINKNCVRDDLEHYIFSQFRNENQEGLRVKLYAHAIWLNFFLIDGISDRSAQAVTRAQIKTGLCIDKQFPVGEGSSIRTDLFAEMHNTDQRSYKYFENIRKIKGLVFEESIPSSC